MSFQVDPSGIRFKSSGCLRQRTCCFGTSSTVLFKGDAIIGKGGLIVSYGTAQIQFNFVTSMYIFRVEHQLGKQYR